MDIYTKQRKKMVETQLRSRGIRDERVLKAMETIPRHLFVDEPCMRMHRFTRCAEVDSANSQMLQIAMKLFHLKYLRDLN